VNVRYVTVEWVVAYHQRVMEEQGREAVLMAPEKLAAAADRPSAEAFGAEAHPTLAEKAAALVQGIAIAHPFMDGNKRAAVGAMLSFLQLNGVPLTADENALYGFVIAVTTGELREAEEIAGRLRELFAPHLD
jgi:death-on-curing protein